MKKRAVIFDFGGVIFKTKDYTPRHQWDEKLGLERGTVERVVHSSDSWQAAQRGELPIDTYWGDVAAQLGIQPEVARVELARDFYSGDELDTDIVIYIRQLRQLGYTIALLSNDHARMLRPRLNRLGITDLFDPLVISSDIFVMKPDAKAYQIVLEKLNRPADETIFIDDRQENIDAANALGIHGVHYTDGMSLTEMLKPLLEMPNS